jgi:hypothetical protein
MKKYRRNKIKNTPGYPLYLVDEDSFNKSKSEGNIDPENVTKKKGLKDVD